MPIFKSNYLFFYYWVVWVLRIFWILTPKSDIGWKYFSSHSIGCFSHRCLLLVSRSFLVWCSPTCLFLLVLPWLLGSYLKHYCQGHCQGGHLLCFILGHLWFQVLCSSLPSSLSWFCVRYKIQVQFHSSARGCAVFLTHLLKRLSFPTFEYSIFLFLCNLFSPHSL